VKITVIGAGSWGSALAITAARAGHDVLLWAHEPAVAEAIEKEHRNPVYLPTAEFPETVHTTTNLAEAAAHSNTIMMVTPSHHFRGVVTELKPHLPPGVRIISGTKGIENDSLKRISEIATEVLGDELGEFAVLSGPTFAAEVAAGVPTAAVVASRNEAFAAEIQAALSHARFRLYRSEDVVGLEIGGSLKNVIAIAAGVVDGLGVGYNTMAALITRGLHEVRKLGVALGGVPDTFAGLAGLGDLVLTCTGSLSRNRRVGAELGKGKDLASILAETPFVAEGVRTCLSVKELAEQHEIVMPINFEMYRLLYEKESPSDAITRLMTRTLKAEIEPSQARAENH
jgi:glycerol-3-phosphate dehydrogenase (NAD(P)+)